MSHPYGAPGYPPQPGHPVPPGYPAPYGYPAPAPGGYGYPPPPRQPSGGTAITAGILSILGGLVSVFMAISMVVLATASSENSLTSGAALATGARRRGSRSSSSGSDIDIDFDFDGFAGGHILMAIAYAILALVLLTGGFMLLRRSGTGRTMVIIGCVGTLVVSIFGLDFLVVVFALATLILAAIGPTKRWIDAGRMPVPVAGGYGQPPYPTYG